MQDNSTNDVAEMLVRYMDGEMNEAERAATEKLLQDNAAIRERFQYFKEARRAIRSQGLKQRVKAIHQEYAQEVSSNEKNKAKVVKPASFLKNWISIAAIFVLAIVGYSTFQYVSTTTESVYSENFMAYQLPVNRGNTQADTLNALYNAGKYNGVINAFNALQSKDQKAYFLVGQAFLQLDNAKAAINAFKQVENINNSSIDKYFAQETDYYLALAYIKSGNIEAAEEKLNKITSNKQHLFYRKATNISRTKLMMLKLKEK
jgi:tetratricopeptide (TPR) repeat protein